MTTKFDIMKLKAKAAMGSCEAMYMLAYDYLYGLGVDVDIAQARAYWKMAADKGFAPAEQALNILYADNGESAELNPEFAKGYDVYRSLCIAADQGDPEALYLKSKAKLTDSHEFFFNEAVKNLETACEKNYAPALFDLGCLYCEGTRISGKQARGYKMINQAAELGYVPAVRTLLNLDPKSVFPLIQRLSQEKDVDAEVLGMFALYYTSDTVVAHDYPKAIRLLKEAAGKGSTIAIYNLGVAYEQGLMNIIPDIKTAVDYYEQGVALGNTDCMTNLGWALVYAENIPHDPERAFKLFTMAAEEDHADAYSNLGKCYKEGIGTAPDYDKALSMFLKAAELGSSDAYAKLALYYMDGVCVPRNPAKAVEWLKKGETAGSAACSYMLAMQYREGDGVEADTRKYFGHLLIAATKGVDEAVEPLADCYRYGIWTEQDGDMAFRLYQEAANYSVSAICSLAQCYTYGIGTTQDHAKAVELYRFAADHGDAQSQYDLGICYRQGEGVEQDPQKAISWYEKAAEQGLGGAWCNLGVMYDNGIGVAIDAEKAFKCYKKSAEAGYPDGMFNVGHAYFAGKGVEQNYQEAVKWFEKAAEQGEPDSMYHLALCYNEGWGVEQNPGATVYYLYAAADRGHQKAAELISQNNIPRPESYETESESHDELSPQERKMVGRWHEKIQRAEDGFTSYLEDWSEYNDDKTTTGFIKMALLYNAGEDDEQNPIYITFEASVSGSWKIKNNKLIHTFQNVDISEPEFSTLTKLDAEWVNAIRDYICNGQFKKAMMKMEPDEIILLTDSVLKYKVDGEVFTSTKVR